jgi:hypothetical protein
MSNIDKYKFNDYTYVKDYNSSDNRAIIEHDKEKPENIFKFYALNKFGVDALIKGYFYASHPIELNDTLDCSPFLFYTSKPIPFEQYERFLGEVMSEEELKEYFNNDCNRENLCKSYISDVYNTATNLFGVISTTGKENNPLMWPHYTQEKGFQIKFNTTKLEKSIESKITKDEEYLGLFPINYTKKLSPIDISSFKTMLVPLYYATNIKSKQWEYEDEWRFLVGKQDMGVPYTKSGLSQREDYIVDKANRYVYYDKGLVEEICFGHNFFNAREFEIEWLDDKNIRVKPKKIESNWEFKNQVLLLDYIVENLNDNLYYSGLKYELDENEQHYLIRTKEKIGILKQDDDSFIITRTNEIIRLMN